MIHTSWSREKGAAGRKLRISSSLSLFPTSVLRIAAQQWSIKTLPFDLRAKAQPIAILTLKNRTLSAVAQLLIEELREVAKDLTAKD